jgi:SAM-dependent methyltransferase
MNSCNICGLGPLFPIGTYARLARVSSDCKPVAPGGELSICQSCGGVQKRATSAFLAEIDQIYRDYDVYYQGGGAEQIALDTRNNSLKRRSDLIVERLFEVAELKSNGAALDFGCGNGVMLAAISRHTADWTLDGLDLDNRYEAKLKEILRFGNLVLADEARTSNTQYDLITMVHALEHMTDPLQSLKDIRHRLAPGGLLFIESPNLAANPFDLLIADHVSHFTPSTIEVLLHRAGFGIRSIATDWISKELSVVAVDQKASKLPDLPDPEKLNVEQSLAWIESVAARARTLATHGPIAVFGTSIAATWLIATIGAESVSCFVDEDTARQGNRHFGKPILAPTEVPRGTSVFICLSPGLAEAVAKRMTAAGLTCVV